MDKNAGILFYAKPHEKLLTKKGSVLDENSEGTLYDRRQSLGMGEGAHQVEKFFRFIGRTIRCDVLDVRSELQGGKAIASQ